MISTGTNAVTSTVSLGGTPRGLAITPDGAFIYVAKERWLIAAAITLTLGTRLPGE